MVRMDTIRTAQGVPTRVPLTGSFRWRVGASLPRQRHGPRISGNLEALGGKAGAESETNEIAMKQ